MTTKEILIKTIKESLERLTEIDQIFSCVDLEIEVSKSKDFCHGDYFSSIPFKIAKKNKLNPVKIAEILVEQIEKNSIDLVEKVKAVKPGYINFFLSSDFLEKEIKKINEMKNSYGKIVQKNKRTILIDYSSPNIAKSFGVGHLRSTIIGQAIYNGYSFIGWNAIGDNHLGDWGTQFGKLIRQIKKRKLEDKADKLTIQELEEIYVEFHKESESNPEIIDEARDWFRKLESKDKEAVKIWKSCIETSINEFNDIYRYLKINIDMVLGESFYLDKTKQVVEELKTKKITSESDGALIIDFSKENLPPAIIVKSDKTTTYFVRDLAAVKYRIEKWSPEIIVYEVGSDQSLYFKQLFEAVKLLGWDKKLKLVHIAHGLVRWDHGKFSTRRGDTIHLRKVLDEAVERSLKIIDKEDNCFTEEEKRKIAESVGIGAVKYNDLSQHYSKDIVFDWDKMLNLKGNSGPYIQYTLARTISVLNKSKKIQDFSSFKFNELNTEEKNLIRKIRMFPEIVYESLENFSINSICNFLFELSQEYNLFYNNNRIINSENENSRLILTSATSQVLQNGLNILGIDSLEKM